MSRSLFLPLLLLVQFLPRSVEGQWVTPGDLARLGIVAAGALATSAFDARWRTVALGQGVQGSTLLERARDIGDFTGQPGVLLTSGLLWGGGLLSDRPEVARTGLRAMESIVASGTVTWVIKGLAGRRRPLVPPHDPHDFGFGRGFGGAEEPSASLPSGHTTAAFAFASSVTAEVHRTRPQLARRIGPVLYGLATAAGFARTFDDKHWVSDVVLGAGIGTVTGLAVVRGHAGAPNIWVDRLLLRRVR